MTYRIPRRSALSALSAIAAAAAAGIAPMARAQAAPLRVGILPIIDTAPFYAAQQLGYFKDENLTVETTVVRGGAAGIPALAAGSLDVLYSNSPSVVLAIDRGIDLRVILQGSKIGRQPPDPGGLVKRKGDPFKTGKDLEGKIIVCNALRDLGWMFAVNWIKATGGDPERVQIIEAALTAQAEMLKQKRVDAALMLDPFFTLALNDPALELLDWPMSKVFPDGPAAFFIITPQLAAQRANEVRAFQRACKRGAAWLNANEGKDAAINLIAGYSSMAPDLIRRIKLPPANAEINVPSLPRVAQLMTNAGISPGSVDLRTKIFT
jgi:NitT/TauT family transport system substrate-binding protein